MVDLVLSGFGFMVGFIRWFGLILVGVVTFDCVIVSFVCFAL